MIRTSLALTAVGLVLLGANPVSAQAPVHRSAYHDYRVVTLVDGLEHPWSIAFLPGGDMLVTEQPGRLRIVRGGKLLAAPVPGVPEVHYKGQGGLMDVVPHPDFAKNRFLYLSFSKPYSDGDGATTAVVRGRFDSDRLTDVQGVFAAVSRGRGHYGARPAFNAEGFLFITVGDRQVPPRGDLEAPPAPDVSHHHGTVNRIPDDGRGPAATPLAN